MYESKESPFSARRRPRAFVLAIGALAAVGAACSSSDDASLGGDTSSTPPVPSAPNQGVGENPPATGPAPDSPPPAATRSGRYVEP